MFKQVVENILPDKIIKAKKDKKESTKQLS
jgi:hypothetical protein